MSNELRDLLDRGAATPSSDVDVNALVRAARGRRRRRVGVMAGAVIAVAAVVVGAIALAQPSSEVSIPSRPAVQAVSDGWTVVPNRRVDGWQVVESRDQAIRFAIPPEWTKTQSWPSELVTVGTADFDREGELRACGLLVPENVQIPTVSGIWLTLLELDGPTSDAVVTLPDGYRLKTSEIVERPADFRSVPDRTGACLYDNFSGPSQLGSYEFIPFRDAGRTIAARILVHGPYDDADFLLARDVLNTLQVGERVTTPTTVATGPTTSTTGVTGTTVPPATVPAGTANATGDEAAIRDVFLAWINAQPKDALDGIVEDFASIAETHRQGMAQHSAADLALYSGRVDSVTIISATRAEVQYTILHDGRPQYSYMPGEPVKIDGTWMVTRQTVCNLLTHGGLTCPPRA
jgi:hypothetical protein